MQRQSCASICAAETSARQKRVRAICANPWLDEGFGTACAGIDEAQRQVLLNPVTPARLRAVAAARQYLVEHGLVQRVAHQNLTKGIAPSAAVAPQELMTPSAPLGLETSIGATGSDNKKRRSMRGSEFGAGLRDSTCNAAASRLVHDCHLPPRV